MQRKSTLAYGSTGTMASHTSAQVPRRRRLDARGPSDAPPRATPSSSPPSGLRLVQPASVPRPTLSSIPPEPTSVRALVARAVLPPPARMPRIEDEAEPLDDADLTFVEDDAPAAAPLPPVPWTAETTPIPANAVSSSTRPPPPPVAPRAPIAMVDAITEGRADTALAVEPLAGGPVAPEAAASPAPRWIAPPASLDAVDEDVLPPLSPWGILRARATEAWAAATPRTRTALTFAAGFVAGGLAVAIV